MSWRAETQELFSILTELCHLQVRELLWCALWGLTAGKDVYLFRPISALTFPRAIIKSQPQTETQRRANPNKAMRAFSEKGQRSEAERILIRQNRKPTNCAGPRLYARTAPFLPPACDFDKPARTAGTSSAEKEPTQTKEWNSDPSQDCRKICWVQARKPSHP